MKSPKVVKGQKIIKLLVKNNYKVTRIRGSHVSLKKDQINVVVVLPLTTIGVYKKIARVTKIPEKEFY